MNPNFKQRFFIVLICLLSGIGLVLNSFANEYQEVDITQTVIVTKGSLKDSEKKAIEILQDEIQQRTGLRLKHSGSWPDEKNPVIFICGIKEFLKNKTAHTFSLPSKKKLNQPEGSPGPYNSNCRE